MSLDFMAALEAEIADLEAELRADVRFVRLDQLRRIYALYTDPDGALAEMQPLGPRVINPGSVQGTSFAAPHVAAAIARGVSRAGRKKSADKAQALEAVELHLNNRSGPVPTRELLEHLQDLGIEVGGSSPLNNLSAMLSNSDKFLSHGRLGWALTPQNASTDAAEFDNQNSIDYQQIFKQSSDTVLKSLDESEIKKIRIYMETNSEIPDDIKDRLSAEYLALTGREYSPGKPYGFQAAFMKRLLAYVDLLGI